LPSGSTFSFGLPVRVDEEAALRIRLKELAAVRVRYGYRRLHILIRREAWQVNSKRVYRLYCEGKLSLCKKTPRRRVSCRKRVDHPAATRINDCWAMDFMADELFDGRRIRSVNDSRSLSTTARSSRRRLWTSRPGKPTDNAFIESFNGRVRAECLNENWFLSLDDARTKVEAWRQDYNNHRPYSSLGNLAHREFAKSRQAIPDK